MGRFVKVIGVPAPLHQIALGNKEVDVFVKGGLCDTGLVLRRLRGQRKGIPIRIFRKVQIKLQGIRPKPLVDGHPVFIFDLQEVPLRLLPVDDDGFLIFHCVWHK